MNLDYAYWNQRYLERNTGWDIGGPSPALLEFTSRFDKEIEILIPGTGNSYEWIALHHAGYFNCHALDFSEEPIQRLKQAYPLWKSTLHQGDFFDHEGQYDLILEQTFFCAIDPAQRELYMQKMASLLKPGAILAGLLFASPFEKTGPPFGGTTEEYEPLFKEYFELISMEPCKKSISARSGNELFFIAEKRA